MDKTSLRKRLRLERSKLTQAEVDRSSALILNNCAAVLELSKILSIHTYLPIAKNNEIDTLKLIKLAGQLNPEVKIASWDSASVNAKARWLGPELQLLKEVPASFQYGLIIVPLLGFDTHGHRLGYGGGFYDQFLEGQEHALTVGLCYEAGHLKSLPSELHDIPLNMIVTEEKIYKV